MKLWSDPVEKAETYFSSYCHEISLDFTMKHSSSHSNAFSKKIKKYNNNGFENEPILTCFFSAL